MRYLNPAHARWALLFAGILLLLGSCAGIDVDSPHLNIDADGYAADSYGRAFEKPAPEKGQTEEEREVNEIMRSINDHVVTECGTDGDGAAHIMLFVHGGLVSTRAAMKSSRELDEAGVFAKRDIQPVYVNWNSSLFSALADDILWVRAGNRAAEGILVAPVVVASRLIEGLFATPPNLYYQLVDESRFWQKWHGEDISATTVLADGAVGLAHAPFSIVSVPLFTGYGRGAWNMMKRRIDVMYAAQKAPKRFFRRVDQRPGAMRTFLAALAEERLNWERECATDGGGFELDFFGHSMGAIVGARMLREFPDIAFDRVIFAAAAATAEDFVTTVPVYLKHHTDSHFFNYGLSVIDEGNELTLKSAAFPRGSLLVWVDNFFDPILSPEDYRVGDFFNNPVFRVPEDTNSDSVCKRMHFVKFGGTRSDRKDLPRRHGDFNEPAFLARLLDFSIPDTGLAHCRQCVVFDACAGGYPERMPTIDQGLRHRSEGIAAWGSVSTGSPTPRDRIRQ